MPAFGEGREANERLRDVLVDVGIAADEGAHLQVLQHRHALEDGPALGHLAHSHPDDLVGRCTRDLSPFKLDSALGCPDKA